MATIRQMVGKKGVNYQIQVKIKDAYMNTFVRKSKTVTPPQAMSKTALEKWLKDETDKFEKEVSVEISLKSGDGESEMSTRMSLFEYGHAWLKTKEHIHALNTQVHYKETLELLEDSIGKVQINNLTLRHIKDFFIEMDKMKKYKGRAIVKLDKLEKLMKEKKLNKKKLEDMAHLSKHVTTAIYKGKKILPQTADKIAKVLEVKLEKIFTLDAKIEPYAYETIAKHRRNIKTIINAAWQDGLTQLNMANYRFTSTLAKAPRTLNYYNEEELKELLEHIAKCKNLTQKLGLTLLVYTGMRRSEISGLDWADIHKDYISINKAYVAVKGHGTVLKETKTMGSNRDISISNNVTKVIKEYKDYYKERKTRLGDMWVDDKPLLVGEMGARIYPQTVDRWLKDIIKENNMRHITVHGLRHTHITTLLLNKVPMQTVSQRAGHSRTTTTMDIYAHVTAKANREAVDIFDKVTD